ncbi:MAG TPA: o-succinylbenzoate--CoA ligase [Pseudogracilibacillus sp.]|nr:o-succinylbenzoate--CoA ligase [Pseudogracilibacillus sp.]
MDKETMRHWLTKQAELAPEQLAVEADGHVSLTFLELQTESEAYAKKLVHIGVKKGTRVAMLATNNVDFVRTVFALSYVGAVVVLLNVRLTNEELTYQLEQSKSELVITTEQLREEKQLDIKKQLTFQELRSLPEANVTVRTEISLAEPFTMMFTSGTTGKPKAVVHTYGNHWWSAIASVLNLGLTDHDKWLLPLPLFHVGGLSILFRSVIYGMPFYLVERYEKCHVFDVIHEKEITIASFVTLMLRDFLEQLGDAPFPEHVRTILLGGGSVPETLLDEVRCKEVPLFLSYGMTETSSQIVTLHKKDIFHKLGSAGKPLFPAQLKIANDDEDGVGEIYVKGPMVIERYANDVSANEKSFHDGWLKTGDLGYVDEDGFLFVVDRRSDLIISGGENIYPTEVENALMSIDGVSEAAVVGRNDEKWGQVPVAFIVLEVGTSLSEEKIKAQLADKLASYKLPRAFYFIDSLPRNAANKVMRHKLKERLVP